jgi:hypothetical protein
MGLPGKKSRRDCGSLGCVDKEGRVSTELVGSEEVGRRTSLLTRCQFPGRRSLGKEDKGREGWLFWPCGPHSDTSLFYTLLHAPSCTQSTIALHLFCGHWTAGSTEVRRAQPTLGLFLFSPGSTLYTECYDFSLSLADSAPR